MSINLTEKKLSINLTENRVNKITEEIKQINSEIIDLGSEAIILKFNIENLYHAAAEMWDLINAIEKTEEKRLRLLQQVNRRRSVSGGFGCIIIKYINCGKCKKPCAHGPYAYHVSKSGGKQHWTYLGKKLYKKP